MRPGARGSDCWPRGHRNTDPRHRTSRIYRSGRRSFRAIATPSSTRLSLQLAGPLALATPVGARSAPFAPVLFRLSLHGWCCRILELQPVWRTPRSVTRSQAPNTTPLQTSAGLAARVVTCVLHCLSLQHPWNSSLAQGLVSRRIALRHWRTPMLPWLALTYTAARLGFEAQNAAAVQLLRLAGGPKTGADEILPAPPVDRAPSQVASRRKEDSQKIGAGS
jgi:hypothetical protein